MSASTLQAAVRRTLFKNAETRHSKSSSQDNLAVSHNNSVLLASNILFTSQGVSDSEIGNTANRIGDKITLLKVDFAMMLELNQRFSDVSYRIMLIKSVKDDVPSTSNIFNNLSGNKILDTFNYERYDILHQKWGKITTRDSHTRKPYLTHLEHPTLCSPKDFSLIRLLQTPLSIHRPPTGTVMDTGCQ